MAGKDSSDGSRLITTHKVGDVLVAAFNVKRLVTALDVDHAARELRTLAEEDDVLHMVLDLGSLKQVSSGFISGILQLEKILSSQGGGLVVCGMSPEVAGIFKTLNLRKILTLEKNESTAIDILSKR